jgi:hypothetical protein
VVFTTSKKIVQAGRDVEREIQMLLTRENGEGIQIAHEDHDGGSLQHWFQGLLVYNHQTTSRHHKKHQRNLQFFFLSA